MQTKSVPGFWPALRNSPFAQSPMNCMPALPSMTIAEARFQSRPEKSASTYSLSLPILSKTSTILSPPSAAGSRSIIEAL